MAECIVCSEDHEPEEVEIPGWTATIPFVRCSSVPRNKMVVGYPDQEPVVVDLGEG